MLRSGISAIVLITLLAAQPAGAAELEGRAGLPADTFAPGPPSGAQIEEDEVNGRNPPFSSQPVQGFSAVIDAGGDSYWALSDNGFGSKDNSADFLLRVYRIRPDFETGRTPAQETGSSGISVEDFISLRDPNGYIPFPIVNEDTGERLLTGADFDPESVRRDSRGDLWFGEEFGPFLLHTDATGRVLEAPIPLPGVESPQNPAVESEDAANLPTSQGFEGMAISPDGDTLYPMLEGALESDPDQRRRYIYEFDIGRGVYTGERWQYRVEDPGYAIGDLTALDENRLVVIERDNKSGREAQFKKIYLIDLRRTTEEGFLIKDEALDLLRVPDPELISLPGDEETIGLGNPFSFPFQTIESLLPLGDGRLLVLNDNNYPFSTGRNSGEQPADTEAIVVRVGASGLPGTGGVTPGAVLFKIGLLGGGAGLFIVGYRLRRRV